jgi:hypothetical protein
MPETVNVPYPEFESVTVRGALVVAINWPPNASETGLTVAAGTRVVVAVLDQADTRLLPGA